jgi:hypothetical protein
VTLSLQERLELPDATLSRSDLRDLGWGRRAIDTVFRACPVVVPPGSHRPVVLVSDYRAFIRQHTYSGDRVRPT